MGIDRDNWWKPFAFAFLLLAIGWGPLLVLDLVATNRSRFDGFAMIWGLGPALILSLVAAALVIGGGMRVLLQLFRKE